MLAGTGKLGMVGSVGRVSGGVDTAHEKLATASHKSLLPGLVAQSHEYTLAAARFISLAF